MPTTKLLSFYRKRVQTEEMKNSRIRLGIHAMETIFAMVNFNYTSPVILTEMLYMYFLSNSRRVCEIYGSVTGGTSTTLRNALTKISKKPTNFSGSGYVVVAFDNNQVLAKTHRVELDSKMKISVVTSLAAFELIDEIENPQKQTMSYPLLYQLSPNDLYALNQKLQQFTAQSLKLVNEYLITFLKRRLAFIVASISESGADYVDESSSDLPNGMAMSYDDVSEMRSSCRIYDQECLLVNPNSYKTVTDVLLHIQKVALSEERKWVTIVVDGIPFCLAQDIIRKSVYCHICNDVLMENDISSHYATKHEQPTPSNLRRVFTNILLRPGNSTN